MQQFFIIIKYLDSSYPLFIILKHKGIISVYIKKWMASESSPFTKAPITPKLVTLRFSKGFALFEVFRKGYKNNGIWAKNNYLYHLKNDF